MTTIAFLGAGNIARAIMGGLIENGADPASLITFDPSAECCEQASALGVSVAMSNDQAVQEAEAILICVKPNVVTELLQALKAPVTGKLLISVAAGITISTIQDATSSQGTRTAPGAPAIIRCMPNTPALVKTGMTALYANSEVAIPHREAAESIMNAVGRTLWVEHEADLDAVTAVSGSGPAYFFLLMESMIKAAIAEGLTREAATALVLQTALGSAKMALDNVNSPEVLRKQVTSPGGTTAAAIERFLANNFESIVAESISAAKIRSIELSKPE